jgi:hypothetical protein
MFICVSRGILLGEKRVAHTSSLVVRAQTLYLGKRSIVKENKRFKVYLPTMYNDLWEELKGRKVKVYIVIEDDEVS